MRSLPRAFEDLVIVMCDLGSSTPQQDRLRSSRESSLVYVRRARERISYISTLPSLLFDHHRSGCGTIRAMK